MRCCTLLVSALINFKPGAFRPGVCVQPVLIRYPFIHFNVAFSGPAANNGSNAFTVMHLLQVIQWRCDVVTWCGVCCVDIDSVSQQFGSGIFTRLSGFCDRLCMLADA